MSARVECPVCGFVMMKLHFDVLAATRDGEVVLGIDGPVAADFCKRDGVLLVGFDQDLVVSPD